MLPLMLKKIREDYILTVREMAKISGFSPAYVSESENGVRMATLIYLKSLKENLHLSEEESNALLRAYNRDRLNIDEDILYYLIDNDLLDSLDVIRKLDKKGELIKRLAKNLQDKKR